MDCMKAPCSALICICAIGMRRGFLAAARERGVLRRIGLREIADDVGGEAEG